MQASQRRLDPPVGRRLQSEFYRFEFFQALRLLERMLARQGLDARELAGKITFSNSTSLSFPASQIEALVLRDTHGEIIDADAPWDEVQIGSVEITPAFFSLLGAHGALPLGYTEQLLRREQASRERAASAFLDIFINRAAMQFYRAWRKYRLAVCDERAGRREYLQILLWLAGAGRYIDERAQPYAPDLIFDETMGGYAAAARQWPVSAVYLQRILSEHFGCAVRVEQFVGKWYDVSAGQCSALGAGNAVLGRSALVGQRVWQRDLRVRLWIGPLDREAFDAFYPGQARAKALTRMLTLLAGVTCEYEVRLVLGHRHVGATRLGHGGDGRLGWNCFLSTRAAETDRSDAAYELQTLA